MGTLGFGMAFAFGWGREFTNVLCGKTYKLIHIN